MIRMTKLAGHETGAAVPTPEHAIIEVTRTGIVTGWSAGATRLYGYLGEEIIGCSADALRPPGRRAEQADVLRRVATAGRSQRYEADLVRKDGTVVTVALTVAPITSPAGAVVGIRGVSWEISRQHAVQDQDEGAIDRERRDARHIQERTDTQRRDARHAQERVDAQADIQRRGAREAQDRFDVKARAQRRDARDAQDQAEAAQDSERQDAQDSFDARHDSERGGTREAQDQAEGTIDRERRGARHAQERTDTQRRDARHAQDRVDARADIQRRDARDAQDRVDARADIQRRDAHDAQDQAEAAQDSERRDAEDLFDARRESERRQVLEENEGLRAQVRQIQRMDSLGQLAGGVAHDFNNLLSVILNYADFVSHRLAVAAESSADGSWDEARADTARIQQAVERAAALTRQLLAFASREAIRPMALDLNEVITNVEGLLRRAIGEHIVLATSLTDADGPWPILADAGKVEQVLINLAVNARDAMPDGGTLTISTKNITTAAKPSGTDPEPRQERHVQLRVSDTGTGMTADVIERAFDPFFTTKAASRGTGLGLATVYGILTQADASIQISSQPGMGTTFTIMLPVTGEAAAPERELAYFDWEPHGETILLVEDDDELREATKRIFACAGYHVIEAASGPEALEIARSYDGPIHLFVTDIVMPHMLGSQAAERIRAIKPGTAVLYMSGYALPVHAAQGKLDADAILVEKPFSDTDLLAKAGQALGGHNPGLRISQGTGV
jgi:PAS domain S-box-containing protein